MSIEEDHRKGITSVAAAGEPSDGRQDARDPGAAGEAPTRLGTADGGSEGQPTIQPANARAGTAPPATQPPAVGGSESVDAVARSVGLPADQPASQPEKADVEGVQRAFGEHAASVGDYLSGRRRGGQR